MDTTVRTNAHTTAIATKNSYGSPLAINTAPHRDPIDKAMATVQAVMRFVQWCVGETPGAVDSQCSIRQSTAEIPATRIGPAS